MKKGLLLALLWKGFAFAEEVAPEVPEDRFFTEFLNMLSSLGLILVGLLIVVWFMKRFTHQRMEQMNTTSVIKVLERRPVSAKLMLYLIEIEGTGLLIAEHAEGVTKLSEFELEQK